MTIPAIPPRNGKLGLMGTSLTMARVPKATLDAFRIVEEEIGPVLEETGYLEDAPFWWVTLAIRYGLKNEDKPHYMAVNKKYGDLPLAIEVDVREMIGASMEQLIVIFRSAALRSLIHAGEKYGRPVDALKALTQQ